MFKKKMALLIICLLLFPVFFAGGKVQAESKPNLSLDQEITATFVIGQNTYTVNGEQYQMDAVPFIKNGRTLLPVRYLGYALGAEPTWEGDSQTIILTRGEVMQQFIVGDREKRMVGCLRGKPGVKWEHEEMEWGPWYSTQFGQAGKIYRIMDIAPKIKNNRTYLPVREVCDGFMADVSWDNNTKTVTIHRKVRQPAEPNPTVELINCQAGNTQVLLDKKEIYELSAAPADGMIPLFDFLELNGIPKESYEFDGTTFKLYLSNDWWSGVKLGENKLLRNGCIDRLPEGLPGHDDYDVDYIAELRDGVLMVDPERLALDIGKMIAYAGERSGRYSEAVSYGVMRTWKFFKDGQKDWRQYY